MLIGSFDLPNGSSSSSGAYSPTLLCCSQEPEIRLGGNASTLSVYLHGWWVKEHTDERPESDVRLGIMDDSPTLPSLAFLNSPFFSSLQHRGVEIHLSLFLLLMRASLQLYQSLPSSNMTEFNT